MKDVSGSRRRSGGEANQVVAMVRDESLVNSTVSTNPRC